ncbi:MAG: glycosyltransferase, partial [Rhodothermales bacterium]|nr:glycosyltransferase [Rhodothermales bacterium]
QAMAAGNAVVTTPLGAAGLGPPEGLPLRLATDAEGLARASADLLAHPEARRALGRRARAFVIERHSWAAYGRRLGAIYDELDRTRPAASRPHAC